MLSLVLATLLSGTGTSDPNPIVTVPEAVTDHMPVVEQTSYVDEGPDETTCRKLIKKAKRKAFWGSLAIATLNSMAAQETAYTTIKTPYGNSTARTTWTDRSRSDVANDRDIRAIYGATTQQVIDAGCAAYLN